MFKKVLADIDNKLLCCSIYRIHTIIVHVSILVAVCLVVFHRNAPLVFNGLDGAFLRTLFQKQMEWTMPGLSFTINPFQGLGNFYYLNPWLSPALSFSFVFFGGDIHPVAVYTIVSIELFLSVLFLGYSFKLDTSTVYLAAWGLTLCALPFVGVYRLYPITAMQPIYGELFAAQSFIIGLYNLIGKVSLPRSIGCGLAILILVPIEVLEFPYHLAVYSPVLFVFSLALFLCAPTSERRAKGLFVALAAVEFTFIACFFFGHTLYTTTIFYGKELLQSYTTDLAFTSIYFHSDSIGKPLFYLYIVGGILSLLRPSGTLRLFALVSFGTSGLILLIGLAFHFIMTGYQGVPTLYIEFYLWPYYFLMASHLVVYLARFPGSLLKTANPSRFKQTGKMERWRLLPLSLVLPTAAVALAFWGDRGTNAWPFPPQKTQIIAALETESALNPESPFRGYTVTLTGFENKPEGVIWSDITTFDHALNKAVGNDYRTVGLWHYGIPTLFEYTNVITPPYYLMTTRFLTRPHDRQLRGVLILTKFDERYLQSLGVRFVITDYPLDREARLSEPGLNGGVVRLYELPNANLGTYSPIIPVLHRTANGALEAMRDESFDFAETVVLPDLPPAPLSKASAARSSYQKDGLRVTASSQGSSLLLLPLQYSHCLRLRVRHANSREHPLLYRANVLQAGLYFQGDIEVDVTGNYGPFNNPLCRLEDFQDFRQNIF